MCIQSKAGEAEFAALMKAIDRQPTRERVLESLRWASELVQDAAYAYAHEISGEQIVRMILLADEIEREARKISNITSTEKC